MNACVALGAEHTSAPTPHTSGFSGSTQALSPGEAGVADREELGIEDGFFSIVPEGLEVECHDRAAGRLENGICRGDVPLRRRSEAWVQIRLTFRKGAKLERASHRLSIDCAERALHPREVALESLVGMTSARDDDEWRSGCRAARRNGRAFPRHDFQRAAIVEIADIESVERWRADDAENRPPAVDQCDVYGKLTVSADELFRSIEWVDEPVAVPALSFAPRRSLVLFREDRQIQDFPQARAENVVRTRVGLGERGIIRLLGDPESRVVDAEHLRVRAEHEQSNRFLHRFGESHSTTLHGRQRPRRLLLVARPRWIIAKMNRPLGTNQTAGSSAGGQGPQSSSKVISVAPPPATLPFVPAPFSPSAQAIPSAAQADKRKEPSRALRYLKYLAVAVVAGGAYVGHTFYQLRQPYEWSGSVEAHSVSVGSRVGGRVKSVLVSEGQRVEKGDVLIVLEPGEYEQKKLAAQAEVDAAEAAYEKLANGALPAEVAQAYARLSASRAAAQQAYVTAAHDNAEVARAKTLLATGSLSDAEARNLMARAAAAQAALSQAGATTKEQEAALKVLTSGTRAEDVRASRAQLALARTKVAAAEAQLEETKIRAPLAVRVESIAVRPGDLLKPDQRAATLLEVGQLYVRIYVPEPHLGKLRIGQQVPVSVDSYPNRTFKARVDHINEVGEFTPRRLITTEERADEVFAARLSLLEGDAELRAGMAAFIHITKTEERKAFGLFKVR
jgi:HlyD family secretion protein